MSHAFLQHSEQRNDLKYLLEKYNVSKPIVYFLYPDDSEIDFCISEGYVCYAVGAIKRKYAQNLYYIESPKELSKYLTDLDPKINFLVLSYSTHYRLMESLPSKMWMNHKAVIVIKISKAHIHRFRNYDKLFIDDVLKSYGFVFEDVFLSYNRDIFYAIYRK